VELMSAKNQAATDVGVLERNEAGPVGPPEKWGMIYMLARIFYVMRQRTEDALKPHNLTPMQFTILNSLKSWDGLSSAELSRRFGVTPQTMGEMIGNLERRALVARVQDPANRRALRLSLTRSGDQLLETCESAMQAVEAEMFAEMSPRDLEALRGRMIGLHTHLGLNFGD
jgi:DNA-binding MarR family transcriptional regulator